MTTAPTNPPPGPTPYQQKMERRRANRQQKREARWERRNAGGPAPAGGMNQEFSKGLYNNTSISNEDKNAIQDVHKRYAQGQATRQDLAKAVYGSGLQQEAKDSLMQTYGGGKPAPAAPAQPKAPRRAAGGRMNQEFSQALYGNTAISNDEKNAIQSVHERFARGQATQQELAQAIYNSALPHDLKNQLMQMYGGGQAAPGPSGGGEVVGGGGRVDPAMLKEAMGNPSRRFISLF